MDVNTIAKMRLNHSTGDGMKSILIDRIARPVLMAIVALQTFAWGAYIALAQEGGGSAPTDVKVDIDAVTGGPGIFGTWWVWVLIAVFLIVVVALTTRSRGSAD